MADYIPRKLRRLIEERAKSHCEYCLIPQLKLKPKHEIEHILAQQHGGETSAENLALACLRCNRRKGTNLGSIDSETGDFTFFFNPRKDVWTEHFQIDEDGMIESLTAEARVTIRILRFNDEDRIEERRELIESGLF